MRLIITLFLSGITVFCKAQQTLLINVKDEESNAPISASVMIKGTAKGYSAGDSGLVSVFFSSTGNYILVTSAAGYADKETKITLPYPANTLEIHLEREAEELEEIIIQSTRTSRTIANEPTRVETIEFEEIDEKNNMRPANVAMLLHESTGIQVQQTSATSANASIRIQGLDGRYTQLLKDGFPNFGNFSSGLSVLEIPPLDLQQVEIIKGPASPLFGGGAIAGVINFISKTPKLKPEYSFILNQSHIGQSNVGAFISHREKKAGYTLLALFSNQKAYDADKDDFTEVPQAIEFAIHPKLFFYLNEKTNITAGNSLTKAQRKGGDIKVIRNAADASHQYFEKNETLRNITTIELDTRSGVNNRFIAKQSFSVFDRIINIPSYSFAGVDYISYTDVSYITNRDKHTLVAGGNFIYSHFKENSLRSGRRDSKGNTGSLYTQYTLDASDNINLETGLRLDIVNYSNLVYSNTEFFILPRISLLVKYNSKWSSRIGAGLGYKPPTIFTEETETIQYRNVTRLINVKSEKSYGGTADVNFRVKLSKHLAFSLNHMFFYTKIGNPLVLKTDPLMNHSFVNASEPVVSAGFETNAKFIYKEDFKLFFGYTFTHAKARFLTGNQFLPLVPKHKLNTALIYEKKDVIKLGLEGYFTGSQYLRNGTHTPAFEEFGFMAEKIFKKFSLYINFENFTDTRQGRYKSVVNGSHLDPTFDEIWTHTEGFVVNGGIKIRL